MDQTAVVAASPMDSLFIWLTRSATKMVDAWSAVEIAKINAGNPAQPNYTAMPMGSGSAGMGGGTMLAIGLGVALLLFVAAKRRG